MTNIALIFGGVFFNVIASFCLKYSYNDTSIHLKLAQAEFSIFLPISAFFYFCAFALYAKSLNSLNLSAAQPIFTIGTLLGVGLVGIFFFDEILNWKVLLSYIFFIFGIILLSVSWGITLAQSYINSSYKVWSHGTNHLKLAIIALRYFLLSNYSFFYCWDLKEAFTLFTRMLSITPKINKILSMIYF